MHIHFSVKGYSCKERRLLYMGLEGPGKNENVEPTVAEAEALEESESDQHSSELIKLIDSNIEGADDIADLLVDRVEDLADAMQGEANDAVDGINKDLLSGVESSKAIYQNISKESISLLQESDQLFDQLNPGDPGFDATANDIGQNLAARKATREASTKFFAQFTDRGDILDGILEKQEGTGSSVSWRKEGGGTPESETGGEGEGTEKPGNAPSESEEGTGEKPKLTPDRQKAVDYLRKDAESVSDPDVKKIYNDIADQLEKGGKQEGASDTVNLNEAMNLISVRICEVIDVPITNAGVIKNIISNPKMINFIIDNVDKLPKDSSDKEDIAFIMKAIDDAGDLNSDQKKQLTDFVNLVSRSKEGGNIDSKESSNIESTSSSQLKEFVKQFKILMEDLGFDMKEVERTSVSGDKQEKSAEEKEKKVGEDFETFMKSDKEMPKAKAVTKLTGIEDRVSDQYDSAREGHDKERAYARSLSEQVDSFQVDLDGLDGQGMSEDALQAKKTEIQQKITKLQEQSKAATDRANAHEKRMGPLGTQLAKVRDTRENLLKEEPKDEPSTEEKEKVDITKELSDSDDVDALLENSLPGEIEDADAQIAKIEEVLGSLPGDDPRYIELQKRGVALVHTRNQMVLGNLKSRAKDMINREQSTIDGATQDKKASGWIGSVNRFLTLSDPYAIEIKKAKQKIGLIKNTQNILINTIEQELAKGPEKTDANKVNDLLGRVANSWRTVNRVDTDAEHFKVEQEAITVTRKVAIAVVTMPVAFVGAPASAGVGAVARFGAAKGAQMASLSSAASNIDEVEQGNKTVGEAIVDTTIDTGIGAATGAVMGAGLHQVGSVIGRMRGTPPGATAQPKVQPKPTSKTGPRETSGNNPNRGPRSKPRAKRKSTGPKQKEGPKQNPNRNSQNRTRQRKRATPEEASRAQARTADRATQQKLRRVPQSWDDLGVPPNSSKEVVKSAYKKMSLKNHPDRNPGNEAATQSFKKAQEAYESLTAHFDRAAQNASKSAPRSAPTSTRAPTGRPASKPTAKPDPKPSSSPKSTTKPDAKPKSSSKPSSVEKPSFDPKAESFVINDGETKIFVEVLTRKAGRPDMVKIFNGGKSSTRAKFNPHSQTVTVQGKNLKLSNYKPPSFKAGDRVRLPRQSVYGVDDVGSISTIHPDGRITFITESTGRSFGPFSPNELFML
jgi:curved DNA-binding protein CbpA